MFTPKDFISGIVGILLTLMGLFPLLNSMGIGPGWFALPWLPVQLFAYIIAGAGFYLAIESIREILNNNKIGIWSFIIGMLILVIGLLPMLHRFGIGPEWFAFPWLTQTIFNILFIVEGVFLFIAAFAMEL
ncbi:MAG: hypothetical protein AABY14_03380 [Nanoarchaeota archaeon]